MKHADPLSATRRRLWGFVFVAVGLLALAAAWSWSPLKTWLDLDTLVAALQRWGAQLGPVAAVLGFAVAVALAVPLTFLTLVTLAAYGPWGGMACAFLGAALGATTSYLLGRWLGFDALQRLGGHKLNAVSQKLASRGLWAVVAVRMVPVAPFAIINMVCGATHIRLRHLLLGTAIGMAPSTVAMALFMDQILAALKAPTPLTYALLALTVVLIAVGAWAMKRWVSPPATRAGASRAAPPPPANP